MTVLPRDSVFDARATGAAKNHEPLGSNAHWYDTKVLLHGQDEAITSEFAGTCQCGVLSSGLSSDRVTDPVHGRPGCCDLEQGRLLKREHDATTCPASMSLRSSAGFRIPSIGQRLLAVCARSAQTISRTVAVQTSVLYST